MTNTTTPPPANDPAAIANPSGDSQPSRIVVGDAQARGFRALMTFERVLICIVTLPIAFLLALHFRSSPSIVTIIILLYIAGVVYNIVRLTSELRVSHWCVLDTASGQVTFYRYGRACEVVNTSSIRTLRLRWLPGPFIWYRGYIHRGEVYLDTALGPKLIARYAIAYDDRIMADLLRVGIPHLQVERTRVPRRWF